MLAPCGRPVITSRVPPVKIGDLVVRTYGEGQRPMALIVGRYNAESVIVKVKWLGSDKIEDFNSQYLEVFNESR